MFRSNPKKSYMVEWYTSVGAGSPKAFISVAKPMNWDPWFSLGLYIRLPVFKCHLQENTNIVI